MRLRAENEMEKQGRNIAVVLAAGTGSRMKASVAKQFLMLAGRPLIYYALKAVEDSKIIDECILVTGEEDMQRMQQEIVGKYGFHKVTAIIPGGSERCFSVANAMRWIDAIKQGASETKDIVFIHDGARPFLSEEILERTLQAAKEFGACVAAMPSKDTVKLINEDGFAKETPDRKTVWTVQTPQTFERKLIVEAYRRFEEDMENRSRKDGNAENRDMNQKVSAKNSSTKQGDSVKYEDAKQGDSVKGESVKQGDCSVCEEKRKKGLVTDDASVVELYTDVKVKLVEGSYSNIKVTTPEDLVIAEVFLERLTDVG